jgi:Flp pilus assembly protein TadD
MIRRTCPWLIIALVCLLAGVLTAQRTQQLGKVVGQIRIAKEDFPSHQIMVELRLRGATVTSAYTDMQGGFGFFGLQANAYHVVVNDEGYNPVDEVATVNPDVTPTTMVQIILQPREAKKTDDPAGGRASGSNPYLIDPSNYNRRFPKKAVKEYDKGVGSEKKGATGEAIEHYLVALRIAPDYYPAHNNLGSLYLSKADFRSAEEEFREAVRLNPNEAQAYLNLGNLFLLTRRYSESENLLDEGLKRRPDSAFGHFLRGSLHSRMGKFVEAEKNLREALRLDPGMSQVYLQLVNMYLQENRREDAITELLAFLRAFPNAPAASKANEVLQRLRAETTPPQQHPKSDFN